MRINVESFISWNEANWRHCHKTKNGTSFLLKKGGKKDSKNILHYTTTDYRSVYLTGRIFTINSIIRIRVFCYFCFFTYHSRRMPVCCAFRINARADNLIHIRYVSRHDDADDAKDRKGLTYLLNAFIMIVLLSQQYFLK